MYKAYLKTEINGKRVYVLKDCLKKIGEVDAIIFDCDGVLIDIRESYSRAISETVSHIVNEFGYPMSNEMISKEIIHLFKKSGGFNNDWDLTYAILMFAFSKFPLGFQELLIKYVNAAQREKDLFKRFLIVRDGVKEHSPGGLDVVFKLEDALEHFARRSDVFGIDSIEKELMKKMKLRRGSQEYYEALKRFLSYPGNVNESLVTRIFEEIFCGSKLFSKIYGDEPRFYKGRGLIENERVISQPETLDHLKSIVGKANFGISSGRPFKLAEYSLRGLLKKINQKALIFLDDVEFAEREKKELLGNLKKPNPFSLLKSSEELEPFNFAFYIGDSMEDVIMVREANKVDPRFLFVGTYGFSDFKEDISQSFLKEKSEIVLPSINELPTLLKIIKWGKKL